MPKPSKARCISLPLAVPLPVPKPVVRALARKGKKKLKAQNCLPVGPTNKPKRKKSKPEVMPAVALAATAGVVDRVASVNVSARKPRCQPLHQRDLLSQFRTQRTLPGFHGARQMRRMLDAPPFTAFDQLQFVQPLVERITERAIEVAIEEVVRHRWLFPVVRCKPTRSRPDSSSRLHGSSYSERLSKRIRIAPQCAIKRRA